jgi:TRAP-type C4-dicarboxylate transport system permease small subunit
MLAIAIFIYWVIGVYVAIEDWRRNDDVSLGFVLASCLIFWVIWPFIVINAAPDIIVFKKKGK